MTSKLGRPSGRPRSRSSIVGHPGASPQRGGPVFSPPPGPPSSTNGARVRWPIDADAPWKSHGRLRGTARTEPSTAFSTELGKPANGCRFPTASTGRRRSVAGIRSASPLHYERNIQSTAVRRWQHNQPVHQIGAGSRSRCSSLLGSRTKRFATVAPYTPGVTPPPNNGLELTKPAQAMELRSSTRCSTDASSNDEWP